MEIVFGSVGGSYPIGYIWRAYVGNEIVAQSSTYKGFIKIIDEKVKNRELIITGKEIPREMPDWAPAQALCWEGPI